MVFIKPGDYYYFITSELKMQVFSLLIFSKNFARIETITRFDNKTPAAVSASEGFILPRKVITNLMEGNNE